jgi:predicted transglutaminase-like cysteine proteinase
VRSLGLGIALLGLSFLSCAQHAQLMSPVALNFFVAAPRDNPWNAKIRNWQARNQLDQAQPIENTPHPSAILSDYERFTLETRRKIAADTVKWVQDESRRHYIPDGETDHWATLSEVAATNGDDCDGLDLLTFTLLRKLGFSQDEIYRSIIVERDSGQHHMVTLWFEGGDKSDPWLLDPTGVVTDRLVRLSEVPTWSPIEMFDEARHFRVEESGRPGAGAVATR